MEFSKNYHITYLSELPSGDLKVEENTVIAVPGDKQGQFKLYTWYEGKWVYTAIIDKSVVDISELKNACDDLDNTVEKILKIAANAENDELFSKLSKITTKILQAKYELADDVLEQFKNL